MKKLILGLVAIAVALPVFAQQPPNLSERLYFKQKLGTTIPMDLPFKDETGKDVRIGDYFKDRPVILVLVFFDCKSSCLLIKEGLLKTLNAQKTIKAGQDFDVVVVSINHKESPLTAEAMKAVYLANYRYEGAENGWHLLTGEERNIRSLTDSVGFGFTYEEVEDPETKEISERISHPSGIVVLTPHGTTSLYLLGATYPQELLRRGIEDARSEKVGEATEEIRFGCFMYDAKTGKYRPMVERMLMFGGIATALILFTSIAVMSVKHRRTPLYPEDKLNDVASKGGPGAGA